MTIQSLAKWKCCCKEKKVGRMLLSAAEESLLLYLRPAHVGLQTYQVMGFGFHLDYMWV